MNAFINVWADFDPDGTRYIQIEGITGLLNALIEKNVDIFAMEVKDDLIDSAYSRQRFIQMLQLKLYSNYSCYNFHDILIGLCRRYICGTYTHGS